MEELVKLGDCMVQASALLADEDADEASSRRASSFLNVVAFGNVVSLNFLTLDDTSFLVIYSDMLVSFWLDLFFVFFLNLQYFFRFDV